MIKALAPLACCLLIAAVAVGCGSKERPRSLGVFMLERSSLPNATPKLVSFTLNGNANGFATTLGTDSQKALNQFARALREAGYRRGSARQFRASSNKARIPVLIEGIAEFKNSDGAETMVERARKNARKSKAAEVKTDLGDSSSATLVEIAKIPVYKFVWRLDNFTYYLAVGSSRNGGPSKRGVMAIAKKLTRKGEAQLK